jgi:hypothetical protein
VQGEVTTATHHTYTHGEENKTAHLLLTSEACIIKV